MPTSKYTEEPSGISLMQLLDNRMRAILHREEQNDHHMCLYATGGYWTAFERSAYLLSQLFPDHETFVVNHPDYPFPVIGLSVSADDLQKLMHRHIAVRRKVDYVEYRLDPVAPAAFAAWHRDKVRDFLEMLYGEDSDGKI